MECCWFGRFPCELSVSLDRKPLRVPSPQISESAGDAEHIIMPNTRSGHGNMAVPENPVYNIAP